MLKYLSLLFAPWFVLGAAAPADDNEIDPKTFIKDEITEPREFQPHERKATCRKYEGKYISYAGNVYLVEKCKSREVQNSDVIFELNRDRKAILTVEAEDLARLEVGEPILTSMKFISKKRNCKDLEGKYVTFSYTDVYFIDKCQRHLFPDWETYVEHRKKRVKADLPVDALTWDEFNSLKVGKDVPTILDAAFAEQLQNNKTVEVIPIDEACKGIEGKFVTFYSKMYFIDKCRKREMDPEDFTIRNRTKTSKLVEMQPEQWLSIPDGKPYRAK